MSGPARRPIPPVGALELGRFRAKIHRSETCWEWTAGCFTNGYGQFQLAGQPYMAHRIAWTLENGPIPDGLSILHRCDNKLCVRPDHLWVGTHDDNMADMAEKGRAASGDRHGFRLHPDSVPRGERNGAYTQPHRRPYGERIGCAKLTDAAVVEMRDLYAAGGVTQRDLAKRFRVSKGTVYYVLRRENWKHV
jgi:hypothetical protein